MDVSPYSVYRMSTTVMKYIPNTWALFQQCRHPSAFDDGGDSGFMVLEKRRPWVSVIVGSRRLIEMTVAYFWSRFRGDGRSVLALIAGYSSHFLRCIIRF